jgi:hypothetical protein
MKFPSNQHLNGFGSDDAVHATFCHGSPACASEAIGSQLVTPRFHVTGKNMKQSSLCHTADASIKNTRYLGIRKRLSLIVSVLLLWASVASINTMADTATPVYENRIRPLIEAYCLDCHSTLRSKGDLDLEQFNTLESALKEPEVWEKILQQVELGEMPPKDKPQPNAKERQELILWVNRSLEVIAIRTAGDPGPVVLSRLNNAELTYTLRDLTGIQSLEPARLFPPDSAAGEGFMNTGQSLVMSPALMAKYLEAGKEIATHAVLLPDGIRFSENITPRDRTDEILANIRTLYAKYTEEGGAHEVNLQGIVFHTNQGGRLPLRAYWSSLLAIRETLPPNPSKPELTKAFTRQAEREGLSSRYLAKLWDMLHARDRSPLHAALRHLFQEAKPNRKDIDALIRNVIGWQASLWKFNQVGHIGKLNGPKSWMEPVEPIHTRQDFRVPVTLDANGKPKPLYLEAVKMLEGETESKVLWEQPRLAFPNLPEIPISKLASFTKNRNLQLALLLEKTAACLKRINSVSWEAHSNMDSADLTAGQAIEPQILKAWLRFLGREESVEPGDHLFTQKIPSTSGYAFIQGWGSQDTPSILANASNTHVRIPGNMPPGAVAVHPSPMLQVGVGWKSPINGRLDISGRILDAHPECGNGTTWSVAWQRGHQQRFLSRGHSDGSQGVPFTVNEMISIKKGDFITLRIGPDHRNHACDLTDIDLTLTNHDDPTHVWNLRRDIANNILADNPHPDAAGNQGVWHFFEAPLHTPEAIQHIPDGSMLDQWIKSRDREERDKLAHSIQDLLEMRIDPMHPADKKLQATLTHFTSPLLSHLPDQIHTLDKLEQHAENSMVRITLLTDEGQDGKTNPPITQDMHFMHDSDNLVATVPSRIVMEADFEWMKDAEWRVTGRLHDTGMKGDSLQLSVSAQPSMPVSTPLVTPSSLAKRFEMDDETQHLPSIIANPGSHTYGRMQDHFNDFRELFPSALCYTKIVPVDEVVTLTLYYREDAHLKNLMLNRDECERLDRLWEELHFISRDALTQVDAYEQLWQYATQDADPSVFEPLKDPILKRASAFRELLEQSQTRHMDALLVFAEKAYRRPLRETETQAFHKLYNVLRTRELKHEEAIQAVLTRVIVSPHFLYHLEEAPSGPKPEKVNDWELASRLSYFLWSSGPDQTLLARARAGDLSQTEVLQEQTRRMLLDPRVHRLSREFATAWLHLYDFESFDEKNQRKYPSFESLRGDMLEEVLRFFTHLFRSDGSLLDIWQADHTFLNKALARHYDIPPPDEDGWHKTEGIQVYGRGGVLGFAATLSKHAGASRTSPILRGNWIAETLLGEPLPKPPADVPPLPEEERNQTMTIREMTEAHTRNPKCAGCHQRIDPYGYALEAYDAIGRSRLTDLADRTVNTKTVLWDGTHIEDAAALRNYLIRDKRDRLIRQFCKKLLGYALGRSIILSDRPLLDSIQKRLESEHYRVGAAFEEIVLSKQFRFIRGRGERDIE